MGNLIDDLLSFSRIGRVETKKTQVSLEELVKEIVAERTSGRRRGEPLHGRSMRFRPVTAIVQC